MRVLSLTLFVSLLSVCFAGDDYKWGADSEYHAGVPKGTVEKQPPWKSTIFPGTVRDWWLYVPAQYDPKTPAAYMVFQDGGGPVNEKGEMRAPVVFDNLIHKKEMPVTIGIFINPGVLPPADPVDLGDSKKKAPRQNRSFEYDSLGDRYVRFLIEEIIPEVEKKYTLSKDPLLHAICGQSSGGSCAFTAAWERPDIFSKVVSGIGSFTSLHGGNAYPDLIRKTEPKPIRVFLQDGNQDLDIYAGSWWQANQDMAAALRWSGYDYTFLQGTLGHSGKQLGAAFPDVMHWLWRTDATPPKRPEKVDPRGVFEVLVKDEGWKKIAEGDCGACIDANDSGEVFFATQSNPNQMFRGIFLHKVGTDGKINDFASTSMFAAMRAGPDGTLFTSDGAQIQTIDAKGKTNPFATLKHQPFNFTIDHLGNLYYRFADKIYLIEHDTKSERTVSESKRFNISSTLVFTPDQGFVVEFDNIDWNLISYRVEKDGSLTNPEPFYSLQSFEGQAFSEASSGVVDEKGRLFVACVNGVQIFDQGGRVIGILNLPQRAKILAMCFGGANFDTLYAVTEKAVYSRKLNAKGVRSCKPPVVVPPPRM